MAANNSPMGTPARTKRPPRIPVPLEVVESRYLTPHLVRVTLGGPGFEKFTDRPETDKYVKLQFDDTDGVTVTRTYTVRYVDQAAGTLDIDFVIHGDDGLAGPWASRAAVGDSISLLGPGGGYSPNPQADFHLLLGDLSAVPAIAAALEALPADAAGAAIIEVDSEDAVMDLVAPQGVEVRFVIDTTHDSQTLVRELRGLEWPDGEVQVFAHGEREAMKALRPVLFTELGLEREQVSLSGYWARGRNEDRFQAEKREPIGKI